MIERRRPQLGGDAPDHRDGDLHEADERLQPIHDRRIETHVLERVGRASEFEFERRQCLAEVVVELASQIRALLFAGGLQACRETPHLFLRRAQIDNGWTVVRRTTVELARMR